MHSIIGKSTAILAMVGGIVLAADYLPAKALPLSTILTSLEQGGLTSIVEASFDDGVWEVEGFRNNQAVEVHVDPLTGKVLREHPDHITSKPTPQAKSAAAIVKQLEQAGYAPVLEIEWERDGWEVEAVNSQGKRKLHVAAETGKILSDRLDD